MERADSRLSMDSVATGPPTAGGERSEMADEVEHTSKCPVKLYIYTSKCGLRPCSVTICSDVCHYRYMPLCSPARLLYISVLLAPSIMGTAMAAVLPRFRGLGKGIS